MERDTHIVGTDAVVLVTGASGFIGLRLVERLLERGFRRIRCLARPTSQTASLESLATTVSSEQQIEVVRGDLLSPKDCVNAMRDVAVVYHLATARESKSYPEAFLHTVVTTRNLLDAAVGNPCLKRFVSISSFSVYSNRGKPQGRSLDESCPMETRPELRGDAYCFAKCRQDELVVDYAEKFGVPIVIVRPGYVLGPDKAGISSRIGIDTFGVFLHLGGSNKIPFTYVDNCAEAIVLAGLVRGVEGEIFNVVDDNLPSSRRFLRLYKEKVRRFRSFFVPHAVSYALCFAWERYSSWSEGQLPPTFNRRHWHAFWKKTQYSNEKIKARLGWSPKVPMDEALDYCFQRYRGADRHA